MPDLTEEASNLAACGILATPTMSITGGRFRNDWSWRLSGTLAPPDPQACWPRGAPTNCWTARLKAPGVNGLGKNASAPASLARSGKPGAGSPDINSTANQGSSVRTCATRSNPVIPGRWTSARRASQVLCSICTSASSAVGTETAISPDRVNTRVSSIERLWSSSTINKRCGPIELPAPSDSTTSFVAAIERRQDDRCGVQLSRFGVAFRLHG